MDNQIESEFLHIMKQCKGKMRRFRESSLFLVELQIILARVWIC